MRANWRSILRPIALGTGTVSINNTAQLLIFKESYFTSDPVLNNDITLNSTSSAALQTFAGNATLTGSITLARATTIAPSGGTTLTIAGAIGDGSPSNGIGFTKSSTGTLVLTANNTDTGTTTVNAGTLKLSTVGGSAIAGPLVVNNGGILQETLANQINGNDVTVNQSGTFDLNGYNDTVGLLTLNGGSVTTGAGTLTLGGNISAAGSSTTSTITGLLDLGGSSRTIDVASGDTLDISAVISGTSAGITKSGTGTVQLDSANTFDGAVTIQSGTVIADNPTVLGTSTATIDSGGSLEAHRRHHCRQ